MAEKKQAGKDKTPARVLIVDDHPIVRQGLAQLINQKPDLIVCAEADNAADALKVIKTARPDIAIVDLSLKGGSGMDLIKDIKVRFPKLPVLVLSMRNESLYAERALRAGARGYIAKEEASASVIEGIRRVLGGEIYLSDSMAATVLQRIVPGPWRSDGSPIERLSDRELQVFEMIGSGLTTREIADKLHLSVKTIETYRERIKLKLSLETTGELLKFAIQWVHSKEGS